jgi:carotenoid 1,2-hydratase
VGSVFSPYYRRAWQQGRSRADEHCALNVCLYGGGQGRWTMTERGARHVKRGPAQFVIGPSRVAWENDALVVDIDERSAPLPRRVRGRVVVRPQGLTNFVAAIDAQGLHRWGPIAPCARIEVALDSPTLHWQGSAYLDSNEGDEPISEPFTTWDWMRAPLPDGSTAVIYDVGLKSGGERQIARRFHPDGSTTALAVPERHALPATGWRIGRRLRSEATADSARGPAAVLETLEDTPFYARSLVRTRLAGHDTTGVHETLSAQRFAAPWVQALLPFRMPRRA